MADGLHTVNVANKWLNWLSASAQTQPAANFIQLHTGTPGAAGSSNVSSTTTRMSVTFSAASSATLTNSNTPTWAAWAGTNGEVVTDISVWDAVTSGNFLYSVQLNAGVTMTTGGSLQITTLSVSLTPLAA